MKTPMFKIYLLCFMLLSNFAMYAQFPTEDEDGLLQEDDAPAAIISQKLIWLVAAGILLALYYFNKRNDGVQSK